MLFATLLGVLLGGATVLLLEQWLRAELAVRPAVQPHLARPRRATTSIALRRLPPR